MRLADRERLASQVFNHLTQRIASGAYAVSQALPSESALAAQYNVSKPVVREALTQLATFGMVQISQGRPARVLGVSAAPLTEFFRLAMSASGQGLRDAIELRRALETQTALLAAQRREPQGLQAMAQALEQMQSCGDDVERWATLDCGFHLGLAQAAGNQLMQHLLEALTEPIRQSIAIITAQRDLSGDRRATLARHRAIHVAVERGDVDAARRAIAAHFAASGPVVEAVLEDPSRLTPKRRSSTTPTTARPRSRRTTKETTP